MVVADNEGQGQGQAFPGQAFPRYKEKDMDLKENQIAALFMGAMNDYDKELQRIAEVKAELARKEAAAKKFRTDMVMLGMLGMPGIVRLNSTHSDTQAIQLPKKF